MDNLRSPTLLGALASLFLAMVVGCAHQDGSVWIEDLPSDDAQTQAGYVISPGDLLFIRVWNQESMSSKVRVRQDGRISLPFLNDVEAVGKTPNTLGQHLQARLKDFIVNPVVTVSLEEPGAYSISVVGEVVRPGVYPLDPGSSVLHALASAGGLNEYANRAGIYVVRQGPKPQRIRFTYEVLSQAKGRAGGFRLKPGDVVVVE